GSSLNQAPRNVALSAEISRLEKITSSGGVTQNGTDQFARERYDAFMNLARLYQLSGNPEAAIKALDGALSVSPGDGRSLLEQGRLLISIGEYEKAGAALLSLLKNSQDRELLVQGQYLTALLELFSIGNTEPLAGLAENPDFSDYRGSIYYSLWKITGLESWKTRLIAELPLSPEAKAANGTVNSPVTPLWLLSPGGNSLLGAITPPGSAQSPASIPPAAAPVFPAEVQASSAAQPAPVGAATAQPANAKSAETNPAETNLLQVGLFSKEDNAKTMAARLIKAGFDAIIIRRQVNGGDFWAACVPYGNEMNAMILKLKNAGFESFPVK
ncbi:MAG: tetratricopeptide repeat protein, partial [Treponema sp.]|nr:tetratricopeptide repeat protein [Treponema sp.]